MKRIVFEGYLKEMYPNGIELEGDSAAECLLGLQQYEGFRVTDGVQHSVVLPQFQSLDALRAKTDAKEILVLPVAAGAGGKGGYMQILLGVLLIALTIWNPLGAFSGSFAPFFFAGQLGATLIASGVVQALMPQPASTDITQEQRSNYLAAAKNTTKVGTRIPLLFGRRRAYGHILSFNVSATGMPPPTSTSEVVAGAGGGAFTAQVGDDYVVEWRNLYQSGA